MLVLLSLFVQSLSIISRFYYVASQVLSVLIKNSTAELCDHWCLSVCRSVIRITHKHFYGCWSIATGDAVEVIRFWCWSRSWCGSRLVFTLLNIIIIIINRHFKTTNNRTVTKARVATVTQTMTPRDMALYTICCHSPEGDTAAALAEFALFECFCLLVCIALVFTYITLSKTWKQEI